MFKMRSKVALLSGLNPDSLQYVVYCLTILSGIIIRITFGTLIVSLVDNVMVLSPNGKSCTIWGLVIKAMKWSICPVETLILGVGVDSTDAPLP